MKTTKLLIAVMALAVMCAGLVYAATPGGATVTGVRSLGEITAPSAGNVDVEAGNVTYADLDTNQSTFRWVGLLGNVSGNIVLGDASSNALYQWTGAGNIVYASTAGSITWSSLDEATDDEAVAIDTWTDGAGADNFTNTFNETGGTVPSNIFTTLTTALYSQSLDDGGTPTWRTYALEDGVATVYAGEVVSAGTGFNGETVDYQMIIPEDGTGNDQNVDTYNLWVELE